MRVCINSLQPVFHFSTCFWSTFAQRPLCARPLFVWKRHTRSREYKKAPSTFCRIPCILKYGAVLPLLMMLRTKYYYIFNEFV